MMQPPPVAPTTRRVIEGFGVVGAAQLLIRIRGVLLIPVLARGLGARDYGLWVLVVGAISLISVVTMLGMPQSLERFLPGTARRETLREDFLSALVVAITATGLVVLIGTVAGATWSEVLLGRPDFAPLIRAGAWILLVTAANQVALMFFRSQREMRTLSAFDVATGLGELLLSALAVRAGYGLYGALLALVAARGATTTVALSVIMYRLGVAVPRFTAMRAYLAFGIPTIVMGLMYWVIETSDRFFVGVFGTPALVGVYSAAYALGSVLVFLRAPFMFVLPPFVYQLWDRRDYGTAARYLDASLQSYLILAIPIAFGVSTLGGPLLTILAGRDFAAKGSPVVPIVVAAMFCYGVSGITGLVFWLQKRARALSLLWAAAAACNTLLNLSLIPRWGIVGAAVATLASYALPAIVSVIVYLRVVRRGPDVFFVGTAVAGSLLMAALVRLLNPSGVVGLATATAAGTCAYVASLALMQRRRLHSLGGLAGMMRHVFPARSSSNG